MEKFPLTFLKVIELAPDPTDPVLTPEVSVRVTTVINVVGSTSIYTSASDIELFGVVPFSVQLAGTV
jgi:hypothetical protein